MSDTIGGKFGIEGWDGVIRVVDIEAFNEHGSVEH